MIVKFKTFQSTSEPWDTLFGRAATFATTRANLITITVVSHGPNIGANGVVTVWYWE